MEAPEAWIISVGNELLIGRTVNTNAAWLAKRLTAMGFKVSRVVTVPDSEEDIGEELRRALGRARLIVTTGGLGPTHDDITLAAVAKALGRELELNEEALRMLKEHYDRRGLPLTEYRIKMAYMPKGALAIRNREGSAPGCMLQEGAVTILSLPGVPREMEAVFEEASAYIQRLAPRRDMAECSSKIKGVPESTLAPLLERLAKERANSYVKSHPLGFEQGVPVLDLKVLSWAEGRDRALKEAEEILRLVLAEVEGRGGSHSGVACS
ncbi:MAG: nicotinamide mononucleotide deamidase-related protein [Acidilobaceae archaeon]|nr:nicotinamide mononucleotide deamidase-related protein [Acidilobaceae archaeon]